MSHLKLEHLTKKFGRHVALSDLSLEIQTREFFVLLGPTGAGKTTTLRCIAGLEAVDSGRIQIDRQDVADWSTAERDVAIVFQYYSLYPHYTVRQNLEFPLKSKMRKLTREEIGRRVAKAAKTLRIEHLLDRKTDKLSGGEMQRVSIGRAIVRQPRVFLMDEPLSNLDAKLRELLRAELKELQMNLGATFLYVTHDQVEAMSMGDRIGILNEGCLIQVGTPYEIYNRPKDTFVAAFVGSPAMNLLPGVIDGARALIGAGQFEIALDPGAMDGLKGISGPVTVGVRSEDVRVGTGNGLDAQVYGVENQGVEKIVTLKIQDCVLRATVPGRMPVAIDSRVPFSFNQRKLQLFDARTGVNLLTS